MTASPLRLRITKTGLDTTYMWVATIHVAGHEKPIYESKHRTRGNAQQRGLGRLRRYEAETRRGAFDWAFFAGDHTPRAWGWLTCTARTADPEKGYLPIMSKIIRATAGLPVQLAWVNAKDVFHQGELSIRVPFKTAWSSKYTEKRLREADRLVTVNWVETDWLASLTGENEEEAA